MAPSDKTSAGLMASGRVSMASVEIDVRVRDHFAEFALAQRFRNADDAPVEAEFQCPMVTAGGTLSLHSVRVQFDSGRVLAGKVRPQAAAAEQYDDAVASGRTAVLVEQSASTALYRASLGALPPRTDFVLLVAYSVQLSDASSLVVPHALVPCMQQTEFVDSCRTLHPIEPVSGVQRVRPPCASVCYCCFDAVCPSECSFFSSLSPRIAERSRSTQRRPGAVDSAAS